MTHAEQVKELKARKQRLQDKAANAEGPLEFEIIMHCQAQIKLINWELECLTGDKQ